MNEKKHGLPEIELFDFEEEEIRDVEAIKIFMKKYSKLWKFYFNKYANMCYSVKHIRNFEQLNDKLNTINMAEMLKLLKEHGFDKKYITKEELSVIIRQVNFKKIKKNDLTALNYAGFLEWIIQVSMFVFTKPPEDKSHLPPVECLQSFFRKLEKGQKDRGASTILFEDPDATSIGDPTLLNALNKKIKVDPNYPIPEDYKKVKEREITYEYKLPDYVPVSENKRIAMELLDEIIFEKLQLHFLEPLVSYKETLKVKPIIRKQFNNATDGRSTPRYLQSLDKRTKPNELNDKVKISAHQKMRNDKKKPVKVGEVLALEVAKFDKSTRSNAQEVAEILEEILQATEKGYTEMPNRKKYGPIGMKNPVIVENLRKKKEDKKLQQEREQKRKKRDETIKNTIKKKEESKLKNLEDTKDDRKRQREDKKKRKSEIKAKRTKEKDERAKEYEEKKKQEMEDMDRRHQEEEEREKKKQDKFKSDNKVFLKEQAKKIRKDFKDTYNEKQSIQQAEKEYEEMSQKLREDMKKKMEKYFEENKDNLRQDKEEKIAINKFMKTKPVQKVFDGYNAQLRYFFDYYCKIEHTELTRDIEKEFEVMTYKEFVRFGYESNIIPTIIPVNQIIYIFHQLVRERTAEDPSANNSLDYEYFKKGLVRISAVGQALLGGQNGPKFEKKMEELKGKEDKDKKRKEALAKKFSVNNPVKSSLLKDEKEDLERDEDESQGDAELRNPKKLSVRREGTLFERGAKPPRQKIIIPNPKEDKLKSATLIKGKINNDLMLNKKSMSINKLYEIDSKAQIVDHLKNVKVENNRVSTECDVGIISDKTIESLLKHIGLDAVDLNEVPKKYSQELRFEMDKKLNSRRMNIQGAKPNRVKKLLLPEKAEIQSNFDDAVSEEDEAEGESDEDIKKDNKDKKGDKKAEDSDDDKSKK